MTPTVLKQIMLNQNLSNLDLATIADVSERQVRNWITGFYPIPRTVAYVLLALEENTMTQDWLANILQNELREQTA